MTREIRYYELVERSYTPNPNALVTAAVWSCELCGGVIDGMGGPGNGELCIPCGGDILSGKFHHAVTRTDDAEVAK